MGSLHVLPCPTWDVCGDEVTEVVICLLQRQDSPEAVHKTFTVLIPMVASPQELG
jgi:hypothetical protein